MTWQHHRTVNPRRCDRCVRPALWNLVRRGLLTEYVCDLHAQLAAEAYELDPPPVSR